MKATYKLKVEQYQRRLNMSHKQLNKYDRKHNDTNLLKKLQILNPVNNTGFYGTLEITNTTPPGSIEKTVQVKLAYNNIDITNYITIEAGETETLTVPIDKRLPNPEALLQYFVIFQVGVVSAEPFEEIVGFLNVSATGNPPEEENMCELLIDSGFINNGQLIQEILIYT